MACLTAVLSQKFHKNNAQCWVWPTLCQRATDLNLGMLQVVAGGGKQRGPNRSTTRRSLLPMARDWGAVGVGARSLYSVPPRGQAVPWRATSKVPNAHPGGAVACNP